MSHQKTIKTKTNNCHTWSVLLPKITVSGICRMSRTGPSDMELFHGSPFLHVFDIFKYFYKAWYIDFDINL